MKNTIVERQGLKIKLQRRNKLKKGNDWRKNQVVKYIPLCIGDEEKKEDDEGKKEEIESEEEAYLEADAEGGAFTCNK